MRRHIRPAEPPFRPPRSDCVAPPPARAAEVRNILDFPAEFAGATVVTLETNYRATHAILDATNRIIGLSPKRHAKELRSVKGNDAKPALITCEREDQTDFVVEKVLEHNVWFRVLKESVKRPGDRPMSQN